MAKGRNNRRPRRKVAKGRERRRGGQGAESGNRAGSIDQVMASLNGLTSTSAVIPVGNQQTLKSLQRFRTQWSELPLAEQFELARWLAKYNWFAKSVTAVRMSLYGTGFGFAEEGQAWAGLDPEVEREADKPEHWYPWKRTVKDLWREYLTCQNVVAMWRRGEGLPMLTVPDCETLEWFVVGNTEVLKVKFKRDAALVRNTDLHDEMREAMGEKMFEARLKGKAVKFRKDDEDEEWNFEVLSSGKTGYGLESPSLIAVADDLDYIDLVGVGDWNGAWKRREVIRHIRQGYKVDTPAAAGSDKRHATPTQQRQASELLGGVGGAANLSTNFDMSLDWHTIAADFFGSEGQITREARGRLVMWGGAAARLLMEGFSQIRERGDMMAMVRTEVLGVRDDFEEFLGRVFNHPDFRPEDAPVLRPVHSQAPLYSVNELVERVRFASVQGLASPQTAREDMGYSDSRESRRMSEAGQRKEDFTPPFESRQGGVHGGDAGEATPGRENEDPDGDKGGRPPNL